MKAYWGSGGIAPRILTSALDGGEWSASRFSRFTPRERDPGTHWLGGWVGPRAVLDSVVKRKIPSLLRESNPRIPIVQPVAQRYTDWAVQIQSNYIVIKVTRKPYLDHVPWFLRACYKICDSLINFLCDQMVIKITGGQVEIMLCTRHCCYV
jgi:hypothetical protein